MDDALAAVPGWFWTTLTFVLGAMVGSFLNVCIHRMPRGESVVHPRSKCGSCGKTIPWFDNIPLLSYLLLGGRCRNCGAKFSPRYLGVELLTALLFVAVWRHFGAWEAVVMTIFVCGLVAATFIDFEHLIIPDEITWGGVVVGVLCSGIVPEIQGVTRHATAALWSLAGAATGYAALWTVVEMGKRVFGMKRVLFPHPTEIFLTSEGLRMGEESERWDEIFSRESDTLRFEAFGLRMGERTWEKARVRVNWRELRVEEEVFPLESLGEFMAITRALEIPREAMGYGDVKFLAAIGAFLGPLPIFVVILLSSLAGSAVGLTAMALRHKGWGTKIPYGPYLALAALAWIFEGPHLIGFWLRWTH